MYEYKARVITVHDADTVNLDIDCGLRIHSVGVPIRLLGLNAPELTVTVNGTRSLNPAGEYATEFLLELLGGTWSVRDRSTFGIPGDYHALTDVEVIVRTVKDRTEKYGRYLGILIPVAQWVENMTGDQFWSLSYNKAMLDSGQAVPYME